MIKGLAPVPIMQRREKREEPSSYQQKLFQVVFYFLPQTNIIKLTVLHKFAWIYAVLMSTPNYVNMRQVVAGFCGLESKLPKTMQPITTMSHAAGNPEYTYYSVQAYQRLRGFG